MPSTHRTRGRDLGRGSGTPGQSCALDNFDDTTGAETGDSRSLDKLIGTPTRHSSSNATENYLVRLDIFGVTSHPRRGVTLQISCHSRVTFQVSCHSGQHWTCAQNQRGRGQVRAGRRRSCRDNDRCRRSASRCSRIAGSTSAESSSAPLRECSGQPPIMAMCRTRVVSSWIGCGSRTSRRRWFGSPRSRVSCRQEAPLPPVQPGPW